MPDTQISEEMVGAFIAAFNSGVFDKAAFVLPVDERCRCGQCLQEEADARSTVRAALEAALSGHVVVPVADLVELTRICNSGEHDAGYTARKLIGHPMQLNVGVLRETFKLIREKIKGHLPAQMEPNPDAGAS